MNYVDDDHVEADAGSLIRPNKIDYVFSVTGKYPMRQAQNQF